MAQAEGALPARWRAVVRPGTGQWALTHRADRPGRIRRRGGWRGARTGGRRSRGGAVTGSVTDGVRGGGGWRGGHRSAPSAALRCAGRRVDWLAVVLLGRRAWPGLLQWVAG